VICVRQRGSTADRSLQNEKDRTTAVQFFDRTGRSFGLMFWPYGRDPEAVLQMPSGIDWVKVINSPASSLSRLRQYQVVQIECALKVPRHGSTAGRMPECGLICVAALLPLMTSLRVM
jgi:hypothetical protein